MNIHPKIQTLRSVDVPKNFKALLPPKFIPLMKHKLETGEMTPEECKEIIKEMMLREYELKQSETQHATWEDLAFWFQDRCQLFFSKLWNRSSTESTFEIEELTGTVRPRHI
jgi:polyhydroxyalkanoate synthesis regulator phasin